MDLYMLKQTDNFLDLYLNGWNLISEKRLFPYPKVPLS